MKGVETWRLLQSQPQDAYANMALDEALAESVSQGLARPTLRFYGFQPAAVSLGYFQPVRDLDQKACQRLGLNWVRRPTGGRAVWHRNSVTYSLVLPLEHPLARGGVLASYHQLSRGLLQGLAELGVAARLDPGRSRRSLDGICFTAPSRYEVVVEGRKLVGSAQVRRQGALLQQGSLPLQQDSLFLGVLAFASEQARAAAGRELQERATSLGEELGREVEAAEVERALAAGLVKSLGISLVPGALSQAEEDRQAFWRNHRYASPDWNLLR